ncbi:MAG TPA: hypothetical protein VHG32_09610 [Thermoanaerobaculia bacterium]|nr:hypothetical protein [Thermoanaerobaculia bacterium]
MKTNGKKAPAAALICGALLLLWFGAPAAPLPAQTQAAATPDGLLFPTFNPPPFDFNDAFYTVNGIDVTQLDTPGAARFGLFRRTGPPAHDGQVNWVIDNTGTDPDRRNVRILATTGGYIDDGTGAPTQFISILAFMLDQGFFTGVANARGIQMASIVSNFEAYAALKQVDAHGVFRPTPCGTMGNGTTPCFPVTSVATPNLRQDWRFATNRNPIDGTAPFGYFCDDILGMWIITYFWYVDTGFGPHQTPLCHQMLAALGGKNGLSLDGTPIIKTGDELNFLEGKVVGTNPIPGFLGTNPPSPPCTAEGQEDTGGADGGSVWLVCPALPDPRNGAITLDAFLDQVRRPNGVPLDLAFTANFVCLQVFGAFCNELSPGQRAAAARLAVQQ